MEIETKITESPEKNPPGVIVKDLADLIGKGYSTKDAAKLMNINPKILQQDVIKAAIKDYLLTYTITPAVARELVRAARIKVLTKNLARDDKESDKLVLEASKQIASDPDVGLNAPAAPLVSIDFGDLLPALKGLDENNVPEIEMPVIDAEIMENEK